MHSHFSLPFGSSWFPLSAVLTATVASPADLEFFPFTEVHSEHHGSPQGVPSDPKTTCPSSSAPYVHVPLGLTQFGTSTYICFNHL